MAIANICYRRSSTVLLALYGSALAIIIFQLYHGSPFTTTTLREENSESCKCPACPAMAAAVTTRSTTTGENPGETKDWGGKMKGSTKYREIRREDLPPEEKPGWNSSAPEEPVQRFPRSLLLGFSKCGTSALLEFLQIHPDVVTMDWETDYFCDRVYGKYALRW